MDEEWVGVLKGVVNCFNKLFSVKRKVGFKDKYAFTSSKLNIDKFFEVKDNKSEKKYKKDKKFKKVLFFKCLKGM